MNLQPPALAQSAAQDDSRALAAHRDQRQLSAERAPEGQVLSRCVCGRTRRPPHCDGSHRELYER